MTTIIWYVGQIQILTLCILSIAMIYALVNYCWLTLKVPVTRKYVCLVILKHSYSQNSRKCCFLYYLYSDVNINAKLSTTLYCAIRIGRVSIWEDVHEMEGVFFLMLCSLRRQSMSVGRPQKSSAPDVFCQTSRLYSRADDK